MHYLTRHLEALRDLTHGDAHVLNGQRFYATDVDAHYYLGRGQAREVPAELPPVAPAVTHAPAAVALPIAPTEDTAAPAQQEPPPQEPQAAAAPVTRGRRTPFTRTPPAEV